MYRISILNSLYVIVFKNIHTLLSTLIPNNNIK